jgi:hypothetical protein
MLSLLGKNGFYTPMTCSKYFGTSTWPCKWIILIKYSLLLMLCLITPISLAFSNYDYSPAQYVFDIVLNVSLLMDMIINFLSAYYDFNINIIDSRNVRKVNINILFRKLRLAIWKEDFALTSFLWYLLSSSFTIWDFQSSFVWPELPNSIR